MSTKKTIKITFVEDDNFKAKIFHDEQEVGSLGKTEDEEDWNILTIKIPRHSIREIETVSKTINEYKNKKRG